MNKTSRYSETKPRLRFLKLHCFVSLLVCMASEAASQETTSLCVPRVLSMNQRAIVRVLHGNGRFSEDRKNWMPLRQGQELRASAWVETDFDSTVELFLDQVGPVIRLHPNSRFQIEKQGGSASSGITLAHDSNTESFPVRVRAVRGAAQLLDRDGKWQTLKVNQSLSRGAALRTDLNAWIDLHFPENGLVLRLTPQSQITLDTIDYDAFGRWKMQEW
ncbi:MAG: hypothetical protein AB1813_22320, partial [Verrucomicrobiota bacterium]